jgi:hypothetical protein
VLSCDSRQPDREPPEEVVEVHHVGLELLKHARKSAFNLYIFIAVPKALLRVSSVREFEEV